MPEGYATKAGTADIKYVYQYKDQTGNVRLSYTDNDGSGAVAVSEIVEEANYYPFGLKHTGYNNLVPSIGNATAQKWKYNDREFEALHGFNMSEMDFRQYDPALGRFTGIDALAEYIPAINPYQFGFNNPVYFSDPSGLFPDPIFEGLLRGFMMSAIRLYLLDEIVITKVVQRNTVDAETQMGVIHAPIPHISFQYTIIPGGGGGGGGAGAGAGAGGGSGAGAGGFGIAGGGLGLSGAGPNGIYHQQYSNKPTSQNNIFRGRMNGDGEVLSMLDPDHEGDLSLIRRFEKSSFEENTIKWFSHGSSNGIAGQMSAQQFDKFLMQNSALYRSAVENNKPLTLKLFACKAGIDDGIAQRLSKIRPNIKVWGATELIVWKPGQNPYIGDEWSKYGNFNIYFNRRLYGTGNFE